MMTGDSDVSLSNDLDLLEIAEILISRPELRQRFSDNNSTSDMRKVRMWPPEWA